MGGEQESPFPAQLCQRYGAAGVVMAFVGGMVSAKAPSLGLTGKTEDVQTDSEIPYIHVVPILLFPAPCIDYAKKGNVALPQPG